MTVMYKKSAVLRAGNYQDVPLMEDSFLWVRMLKTGAKCKNMGECLVDVRAGDAMIKYWKRDISADGTITKLFLSRQLWQ